MGVWSKRRLAVVLVVLATVPTGVGFASIAHQAPRAGSRSRVFSAPEFSFRYPAAWQARQYQENGSFFNLIVDLSSQRMHPPSVTHHGTLNTTVVCGEPIDHLDPGSIRSQ